MVKTGTLKHDLPARPLPDEVVDLLVERQDLRIERIVSTGQTTPEGHWYDQETDEWVLIVTGAARLRIEGEQSDRELGEGDVDLNPGPLPASRHLDARRAADGLARSAFHLEPRDGPS